MEVELEQYVQSLQEGYILHGPAGGKVPVPIKLILVGHSVGAYICMEVLRRSREKAKVQNGVANGAKKFEGMKFIAVIGLWPTITWIGKSPKGRRVSVSFSDDVWPASG